MQTIDRPVDVHELPEYLRVDEIARRFSVSVDDVLAACFILGFHATDAAGLIEIHEFTAAVLSLPPRQIKDAPRRRRIPPMLAASAASLLIGAVGVFGVLRVTSSSNSPHANPEAARAQRAAASYEAQLRSSYEATVSDTPTPVDYHVLALAWSEITPPPSLRAEHEQLIKEAEKVADLASTTPSQVAPEADPTTAATQLRDQLNQLGK